MFTVGDKVVVHWTFSERVSLNCNEYWSSRKGMSGVIRQLNLDITIAWLETGHRYGVDTSWLRPVARGLSYWVGQYHD